MVASISASSADTAAQYARLIANLDGADVVEPDAKDANANGVALRDNDNSPVTVVTLSKDALQSLLQQGRDAMTETMNAYRAVSDERSASMRAESERMQAIAANMDTMMGVQKQMHELNRTIIQQQANDTLATSARAQYDQLMNTKPVPASELTGKDKDAAFALLRAKGLPLPAAGGSTQFSPDNHMLLIFKGDGSVWTRDGNVPETEAIKQFHLAKLSEQIGRGGQDISGVVSQYNALQEQLETLKAQHDA